MSSVRRAWRMCRRKTWSSMRLDSGSTRRRSVSRRASSTSLSPGRGRSGRTARAARRSATSAAEHARRPRASRRREARSASAAASLAVLEVLVGVDARVGVRHRETERLAALGQVLERRSPAPRRSRAACSSRCRRRKRSTGSSTSRSSFTACAQLVDARALVVEVVEQLAAGVALTLVLESLEQPLGFPVHGSRQATRRGTPRRAGPSAARRATSRRARARSGASRRPAGSRPPRRRGSRVVGDRRVDRKRWWPRASIMWSITSRIASGPRPRPWCAAARREIDRDAAVVGLRLLADQQHAGDRTIHLDRHHDLVVLGIEQVALHPRRVPGPEPAARRRPRRAARAAARGRRRARAGARRARPASAGSARASHRYRWRFAAKKADAAGAAVAEAAWIGVEAARTPPRTAPPRAGVAGSPFGWLDTRCPSSRARH